MMNTMQNHAVQRNTLQKEIVKRTVKGMRNHPSAQEVYNEVLRHYPGISKATVYRILNILSESGEILRVKNPDGADIYDFNTSRHYHLHCTKCGGMYDLSVPEIEGIERQAEILDEVTVTGVTVVFEGICKNCKEKN